MDRQSNMSLLAEYTRSQSLVRHMLAVEAAMRAYAAKLGQNEDVWGAVGLLHDFDYELYPDPAEHTVKGGDILTARGYPAEVIRAIQAHNPLNGLNLERRSPLEKALVACDELCGFITAVALVRPSRSLMDLKASSVTKKMKDKAFARQVSREEIRHGAEDFGVELNEHVDFVIQAMRGIAADLGLEGAASRHGMNEEARS
jgi:putative nucleotidyltransferase with HDIG domain